jgi:DNA-binding response OmpR family regulator
MSAHILVIEDDDATRTTIVAVLERSGYEVTHAADGETALALLTQHPVGGAPYDVVITDIRMGAVDGIEVVHAARSMERPPTVIVLTGHGTMDTAIAALRAGAHDYLTKPCKPTDLLDYVDAAMQRHTTEQRQVEALHTINQIVGKFHEQAENLAPGDAPAAPHSAADTPPSSTQTTHVVELGGLRIDGDRHIVSVQGQEVHTTPMEYALLHCLAQGKGRMLSYEEIIRRTHGYTSIEKRDAHALLKPHIRNLRNKLPPGFLITVRGMGYRLVDPADNDPLP